VAFMKVVFSLLASAALIFSISALAQSPTRIGTAVQADSAESLRNLLPLSVAQPPRELATGAEVFLISGYEPSNKTSVGTAVKVHIDRPGSRVLLVLTSYERVNWQVSASPSTTVSGIVVSGYERPTVTTTIQAPGYLSKLPYSYQTENINFKVILTRLNEIFGIRKLDVFRASYSIPSAITISALDAPRAELTIGGATPKRPAKDFPFSLLATDHTKVQWTLTGATSKVDKGYFGNGKIALSKSGKVIYKLNGDELEIIDRERGRSYTPFFPPNFPRFSWAMDLAYDTTRDLVTVVTLGGEGFLYRFDAKQEKWIDFRSLENIDIYSLAYDQKADRYVAWTGGGSLLFISGEGEALFTKNVMSKMEGFGRLYDRGNSQVPRMTVAPEGDDIALLYIGGNTVKRIWYYNVKTDSADLTYKAGE